MCGINGIIRFSGSVNEAEIIHMRDQFTYRGPDDQGCWINPNKKVGIGHRRLSILDPTDSGHQPMHCYDSGMTIVYNGEVYNYLEIRESLQKKGYNFKSGTDTEVILKAYQEWGKKCLEHFNGMFAFAIWDNKEQEMFFVRDRLGIKPLYYFQDKTGFYFASEIKAILAALNDKPSLQEELIDAYMSFGYVPGYQTMHKGISRLLPGHYMVVGSNGIQVEKYWDLRFDACSDRGEKYYLEKCTSLLNSAIDLRLRSDVPLGIFLSGGIDSSTVVGMLAPRVNEPLKTFSVAYEYGQQFNETEYARLVAKKFNTDHNEIFITPDQFMTFIPEFVRLMDEPVTEAAAISLYFVSKLAKEKVTVVLSGEGSDEIFGGYDLYRYMRVVEKYHRIVGQAGSELIENVGNILLPKGNKILKYLSLGTMPMEERYKGISTYSESNKIALYTKDYQQFCTQRKTNLLQEFIAALFSVTQEKDALSRMLYFDTKTWLIDDLLIKADRMSMAASLELRVPFLDYRLVEFAAAMPSKYKIKNGQGKYLLKKMVENILPDKIIHRKKMGFPTPLKIMFENELYDYARDTLTSKTSKISSYFNLKSISALLEAHAAQKRDHHRLLWQLVVIEEWLQQNS